MKLLKLLASDNFITLSRPIAKVVGLEAAVLFGELCSIANLNNYKEFYYQTSRLQEDTFLTEYSVREGLKKLIDVGFVSVVKKGVPCKNYFTLNEDRITEVLLRDETESKTEESSSVNSTIQFCENEELELRNQRTRTANSTNKNCEFDTTVNNNIKNQVNNKLNNNTMLPDGRCEEKGSSSKPAQRETVSLRLREPKNEQEMVDKVYFEEWDKLIERGIIPPCDPPTSMWTSAHSNSKKLREQYGVEKVCEVVRRASSDDFVVKNGFSLSTILSATVFMKLYTQINGNPQKNFSNNRTKNVRTIGDWGSKNVAYINTDLADNFIIPDFLK